MLGGRGAREIVVKGRLQLSVLSSMSSGDIMCSLETTVNNTVLCATNLVKE